MYATQRDKYLKLQEDILSRVAEHQPYKWLDFHRPISCPTTCQCSSTVSLKNSNLLTLYFSEIRRSAQRGANRQGTNAKSWARSFVLGVVQALRNLRLGKAARPEGIQTAHIRITIMLAPCCTILFNNCLRFELVPCSCWW